jgi:FMN phosphatase YigB (HAD superfamily)
LAVLSDYPAEAKLHALGLDAMFDVVLSAQSPGVGVFKPNPRGLYAVMDLLAVESGDCMYVGDRADVDATAAAAAGVRCFIVGATHGLEELQQRLFDRAEVAQLHLDLA